MRGNLPCESTKGGPPRTTNNQKCSPKIKFTLRESTFHPWHRQILLNFKLSKEERAPDLFTMSGSNSIAAAAPNQSLENIKVAVRLRPFTEKEKQRNNRRIVDIEQNTVVLYTPKHKDVHLKRFTFDYSYWSHDGFRKDPLSGVNLSDTSQANHEKYVGQAKVFEDLGQFLLYNALQGYNSALLAYGQTGSGKSYTVSGYGQNEGILPRFARSLFEELDRKMLESNKAQVDNKYSSSNSPSPSPEDLTGTEADQAPDVARSSSTLVEETQPPYRYEVHFSMIEIYNEVVRDLLSKSHGDFVNQLNGRKGLKVREHPKQGFFVESLSSFLCNNRQEIEQRIEEGQLNKSIAATSMNETSSRGHTIYEFKIKQYKTRAEEEPGSGETVTISVVQLVDLAGSERMAVHVNALPALTATTFAATTKGGVSSARSRSPGPRGEASGATGSGLLDAARGDSRAKQPRSAAIASSKIPTSSPSSSTSTASISGRGRSSVRNNVSLNANLQQRFKESVSINQSLSALGNCIQVMSQFSQQLDSASATKGRPSPKIPYRDSVLTKLLNRCCLSGNSKVVIIATLSPADANYDDTLSTLRFADRAKQIRTHAVINRMSQKELGLVDSLQRENNRLKQIVDGRVTRSDDSSQTSNFDENENVMENFTGSKINKQAGSGVGVRAGGRSTAGSDRKEPVGTPVRGKTTIRKSSSMAKLTTSSTIQSSPEQMRFKQRQLSRLVKPTEGAVSNSRSVQGLAEAGNSGSGHQGTGEEGEEEEELARLNKVPDIDDDIVEDDIQEGIISPDSDSDSFAALADEELSQEERIGIFNRLLSNSTVSFKSSYPASQSASSQTRTRRIPRPKRASRIRAGIREVAMLSSSLKKTNPYLSNLNPDEQLSGMISYIIKVGETIVGKSNDADIMLHGPELRGHHARIIRSLSAVYIEPVEGSQSVDSPPGKALMVNGMSANQKTKLNHCDRILFGTNAFFVFADATLDNQDGGSNSGAGDTVANLDMVTYDMARSEVLRKVMSEAKNEAMIKEIRDYTHRPGTGKKPAASRPEQESSTTSKLLNKSPNQAVQGEELYPLPVDGMDLAPAEEPSVRREQSSEKFTEQKGALEPEASKEEQLSDSTLNYRDQLMEDTYEYAMPVAEVNAVAKEMDIKVTYGLKILTGEEQLPQDKADYMNSGFFDSNASDESNSSIDNNNSDSQSKNKSAMADSERLTVLRKLDDLDIPPALYVKVHLDELEMDFYWSKEKFQARRDKILELYGVWDVGGKSGLVEHFIELSKAATISSASRSTNSQTDDQYLFDPFIDDPQTSFVLIGNAQVSLQPISHLSDIRQTYELLDVDDGTVGDISIQVVPCREKASDGDFVEDKKKLDFGAKSESSLFERFTEDELKERFLNEPEKLLGKRLVFELKILSCSNISEKFVNVFCQYTLKQAADSIVKTKLVRRFSFAGSDYESMGVAAQQQPESSEVDNEQNAEDESGELKFHSSHYICFEEVDQDLLDFLRHGFLTIQVVGQYKGANCFTSTSKSPTIVSTIINSINKYKYKIQKGAGSAGSDYNNLFSGSNRGNSVYNFTGNESAKSNVGPSSSEPLNSNSGASSVVSTVNMFEQQNDDDDGISPINGLSQENVIDMILTKRKLDRAENQLRTINIAEHYNKKHIPVKTVKKLLNLYGQELDSGSTEEVPPNEVVVKDKPESKHSACRIQ